MASPNSEFTELVTTTLRAVRSKVYDNVSTRTALYHWISEREDGIKVVEDGGLTLPMALEYAENSTYQRYSDWDTLNIAASDVLTSAEYQWRQIALHVVASGREIRINSGKSAFIDLAKSKINNAIRTFTNNFSTDLYSDGTLTNQINGIQALVSDTGAGTVGGIDASAYTFWANQVIDASALSVTTSATTIEGSLMLPAWLATDIGPGDRADLILMDSVYFKFFETSQVSFKQYANTQKAAAGFTSLKYHSADVVYDATGMPASHAYFLNTQYLKLFVHKDANLEVVDEMRPINQDGSVTPILWMGNLGCANRARQAVIHE
jgi:hypothetical protein